MVTAVLDEQEVIPVRTREEVCQLLLDLKAAKDSLDPRKWEQLKPLLPELTSKAAVA